MELNNQQTEKVRTVISLFFNQYIKIYTSCILGNVDKQEFVDLLNLLDLTKNEVRDVMHDVFGINEPLNCVVVGLVVVSICITVSPLD